MRHFEEDFHLPGKRQAVATPPKSVRGVTVIIHKEE